MKLFEDEYVGRSNLAFPSLFYDVAAAISLETTAQEVCDAVLAAWEAAPEGASDDQVQTTYRKFLLPLVTEYARENDLSATTVCDALVTCAQYNEAVELRKKEREEHERGHQT